MESQLNPDQRERFGLMTGCFPTVSNPSLQVRKSRLFMAKITSDGDCSHGIRRHLLLGKAMTNLDSVLKSRDITLLTKIHLVKVMVFPVVMYG